MTGYYLAVLFLSLLAGALLFRWRQKLGLSLSSGLVITAAAAAVSLAFPFLLQHSRLGVAFLLLLVAAGVAAFFLTFLSQRSEKKRESEIASPVAADPVISRELKAKAEKTAEKELQVREELKDVEEAPPAEEEEKNIAAEELLSPAEAERAVTTAVPKETEEVAGEPEEIPATPIDEQVVTAVEIEAEKKEENTQPEEIPQPAKNLDDVLAEAASLVAAARFTEGIELLKGAFALFSEPEDHLRLVRALSAAFREAGQYEQALLLLMACLSQYGNYLEEEDYREIAKEIEYTELLHSLLQKVGMSSLPVQAVPEWIKKKALWELKLREKKNPAAPKAGKK